jgi:hypothetical protein
MTAAGIAVALGMALSTVSAVLRRVGLGKRSRLEPPEPANRYERRQPGELIHIDVKKLGRILKPGHRVTGKRIKARNTYTPRRAPDRRRRLGIGARLRSQSSWVAGPPRPRPSCLA